MLLVSSHALGEFTCFNHLKHVHLHRVLGPRSCVQDPKSWILGPRLHSRSRILNPGLRILHSRSKQLNIWMLCWFIRVHRFPKYAVACWFIYFHSSLIYNLGVYAFNIFVIYTYKTFNYACAHATLRLDYVVLKWRIVQ